MKTNHDFTSELFKQLKLAISQFKVDEFDEQLVNTPRYPNNNLVGGLEHFLFSHMWELHHPN